MRRLVVATHNPGKLREIQYVLDGLGLDVASLADYPHAPEVEEPHATFTENAAEKATVTAAALGEWVVADDSGLEVEALDGAPGVYSSRVAPSDPERIAWLLARLRGVPPEQRQARFVCALALASPAGLQGQWLGTVEGRITEAPAGVHGFGYDPVFLYPPTGRTFGEMLPAEKSQFSHRGRALREFRRALEEILRRSG